MASEPVLDFDALLGPISDDSPSGIELKDDDDGYEIYRDIFDRYKVALKNERDKLHREMKTTASGGDSASSDPSMRDEIEEPDWSTIIALAIEIISTRSKDLSVVAFLTHAITREHGLAGARDGCRLARELCEKYWDSIHPAPSTSEVDGKEVKDYTDTTALLQRLIGDSLVDAVSLVPIAPLSYDADAGNNCLNDYRSATHGEGNDDVLNAITKAVDSGKPKYYLDMVEDIGQAQEHLQALSQFVLERVNAEAALSPAKLRETFQEFDRCVRTIAEAKLEQAQQQAELADDDTDGGDAAEGGDSAQTAKKAASGAISSREDALRQILKIAEFFRKTEPPSPVPSVLEQAVRWARMSHEQLMKDLISDNNALEDVYRRTGIGMTPDGD